MYRRVNLEDATYYQNLGDNAAGHIRAIVLNGYWPDGSNGQTLADLEAVVSAWAGYTTPDFPPVELETPVEQEPVTEEPTDTEEDSIPGVVPTDPVEDDVPDEETADLEPLSRSIVSYSAAPMTEITDVSNLTPGEALAGTQLAVWYYGNKGTAYVDTPYTGTLDITDGGTHQSIIGSEANIHGDGVDWPLVNSSGRPQGTAQYSAQSEYNILAVRDYLLSLPPMELEEDNIIFSENYFVDWTYAAADSADSPDEYVATLKFALQGNPQASDGLTLTTSQGNTPIYSGNLFGDSAALTYEDGVFILTFSTNDLDTADLENATEIFAEKGLTITTSNGEAILFRCDGDTSLYTGEISVRPEETMTLTGIPTGTTYTVAELDGDNLLYQGEGNSLYYTPEAEEMSGTVDDGDVTWNNTLYVPAPTTLTLYKVVQYQGADVALAGRQFTFRLTRWDGIGWSAVADRLNDPDTGAVTFELTHTALEDGAVIYYQIAEVYALEQSTGYLYTPPIFAKVTISNENGVLSSTVEYFAAFDEATGETAGEPLETPTFVNRLTGDTELTLQGVKYLDGELSTTRFSFTLTDVTDPDAPQLLQTVENTGSGLIQFDTIRDFPRRTSTPAR